MHHDYGYGLWFLALFDSAIFILFALSFFRPRTSLEWRSFGAFSAFIIALFTEMYGFPLTIYLLSGWLQRRFPGTDFLTHDFGHLWPTLLGWKGDPHLSPFHIASYIAIGGGFVVLSSSWSELHKAQTEHRLATGGPYAYVRHPQYSAFMAIMLGFLLQWPTLLTLAMFPILCVMYVRLAWREERAVVAEFGSQYQRYAEVTPAFVPRIGRSHRERPIQTREVHHG